MELRQLKYFLAVAEELHFGRAAEKVHIAQPPLSQQIKALEEELGAKLFLRNSRNVQLTEEGKYFRKEAVEIFDKINNAADTVFRMAKGETGRISVGFMEIAMDSHLPEIIRSFKYDYPDVRVKVSQLGASSQMEKLRTGQLQVGFCSAYKYGLQDLDYKLLFRKQHLLAMPEDHALAAKDSVTLEDVAGERLIIFPRVGHPDLYDSIFAAFHKKNIFPGPAQEVAGISGVTALIAAGMGVSFVPENTRIQRKGIVTRPLADNFPTMDIYMVWKKGEPTAVVSLFLEEVAAFYELESVFASAKNS
jgi:DNA-binding transcriptional LysR family regulator